MKESASETGLCRQTFGEMLHARNIIEKKHDKSYKN